MKVENLALFVSPCLATAPAPTPQMGWNTWNTFGAAFNQSTIHSTASTLISSGLAAAGYNYVVLDEGWQALTRDSLGRQELNATKFPGGMQELAGFVHDLGLKIGLYSDAGIYDCGFYPGSFGYEDVDAQMYAEWGVDYLKYDNCAGFYASTLSPQERFLTMSNALKDTGREILFSLCQWGNQFPWFWADQISESYRMSGDIHSSFSTDKSGACTTAYCLNTGYAGVSVLTIIRKMREISPFQAPGSWADMDMLEIGTGTMNLFEEQTHFSFWAALKSPLIIGADITRISNDSLAILLNKEIIAINQDKEGIAVTYMEEISEEGEVQTWAGPLEGGRTVLLVLNYGSEAKSVSVAWRDVQGLGNRTSYSVRDVWAASELGIISKEVILNAVQVHQTKLLVLS